MARAKLGAGMAVGIAMLGAGAALSADPGAAPSGETVYADQCAGCHGLTLGGSSGPAIGPALKGEAFVARWSKIPPADFLAFVHSTMPLNAPGSLDEAPSAAAANHVLAANGLPVAGSAGAAAPLPSQIPEDIRIPVSSDDQDARYHAAIEARVALIAKIRPVDDAMLARPAPGDWLSWRGTPSTQGFSPLTQIDRGNVARLGLGWSLALPPGTNGIAPLIHDGVMFINSNGTVEALDARNGDSIWRFVRPAKTTRVPSSQARSMALYGEALYVPTVDNHVLALDAKSGRLLWDHEIGKPADRLQLTAAPLIVHGKVIQGVSGCQGGEYGGGCYIVALDAKTGAELWRFNTIPRPGTLGDDSWNGAPVDRRYGGSVWVTGSYDPDLNLVFFGVGQTYTISTLLDRQPGKGKSNDALFTNTTLALNPDTGRLVWHFQHVPADVWDLDWSFERTLVTLDGPGGPRRIVVTGGKTTIFDALDARTGRYLWSRDLGLQNIIASIDPRTGRKSYDPKQIPEFGKPKPTCPSTIGNRNWMTSGYDPASHLLYVPITPTCMDYSRNPNPREQSPESYGELRMGHRRVPNSDGSHGWLAAIDLSTSKVAWINKRRAPQSSAVLTTAGGLLFEGGRDRAFRALDTRSGDTLWQTLLPATPNAFPFSYMVDGVQYVGIVTGGGSAVDAIQTPLTPEYPASNGSKTIMVFALPSIDR